MNEDISYKKMLRYTNTATIILLGWFLVKIEQENNERDVLQIALVANEEELQRDNALLNSR